MLPFVFHPLHEFLEPAFAILTSVGHQEVDMGVEIDLLSDRVDGGHHPGNEFCAGCGLEVFERNLTRGISF